MGDVLTKNLKKYRIRNNYTVKEIAVLCDCEPVDVLSWEEGITLPKQEIVLKLATLYKVPVEDFMSGETLQYKISVYNGIFNAIVYGLLVLAYLLPFARISEASFNGLQLVFDGIVVSYTNHVLVLFILYVIGLILSVLVLFITPRYRYMYRYFNALVIVSLLIYVNGFVFQYSTLMNGALIAMNIVLSILFVNNLADMILHKSDAMNEDHQLLLRKSVTYTTLLLMVLITFLILFDLLQNINNIDLDMMYVFLVLLLVIFDILGVFLPERVFHSRKWISLYLAYPSAALVLFIVVGSIIYGTDGLEWGNVFLVFLCVLMPVFVVNVDYFMKVLKHFTENRKDTFTRQ